ncbi:MAG: J domain-containing protein [Bacteroidetes bacterium]|nr:J domain-containing protein [Bacteroidota bacterium]
MNFSSDYYGILGLEPTATEEQIKKSFRDLVRIYHPDRNNENKSALLKFAAINEAYQILSEPQLKRQYDSGRNNIQNSPYAFSKETNRLINVREKKVKEVSFYEKNKKPSLFKVWGKPIVLIIVAAAIVYFIMNFNRDL